MCILSIHFPPVYSSAYMKHVVLLCVFYKFTQMVLCYKCILLLPLSQLRFGALPTYVVLSGFISFLLTTARSFVICNYHSLPSVSLLMGIRALCYCHQPGGGHGVLPCESFCRGCIPRVAELGHALCILPFNKPTKCSLK